MQIDALMICAWKQTCPFQTCVLNLWNICAGKCGCSKSRNVPIPWTINETRFRNTLSNLKTQQLFLQKWMVQMNTHTTLCFSLPLWNFHYSDFVWKNDWCTLHFQASHMVAQNLGAHAHTHTHTHCDISIFTEIATPPKSTESKPQFSRVAEMGFVYGRSVI